MASIRNQVKWKMSVEWLPLGIKLNGKCRLNLRTYFVLIFLKIEFYPFHNSDLVIILPLLTITSVKNLE